MQPAVAQKTVMDQLLGGASYRIRPDRRRLSRGHTQGPSWKHAL